MVFHSPQYGVNIPTGYDADHITLIHSEKQLCTTIISMLDMSLPIITY